MKFHFNVCCVTLLTGVLLLPCRMVESSSLIKSPWNNELDDIFSIFFGLEGDQPQMKYNRQSNEWVEECPDIDCPHGKDDGDFDTCPSCLLGPGENCSDWKGKCGKNLVCQYSSAYASTGNCVSEEEFNARTANDSCGHWEGQCEEGLRCLIEPDLWTQFCGIEESGVCVREEQFFSRQEGETCGSSAGECEEGLACVQSESNWFSKECQNLTRKTGGSTDHHQHIFSMKQVIDNSDYEHPGKHISIEVIGDDSEDEVDSFLESEMLNPILKEEIQMIEEIVHSIMAKSNVTSEENNTETTSSVLSPDQEQEKSIVINLDTVDCDLVASSQHITFDSKANSSEKQSEKQMEKTQVTVEIL